MNGDANIVITGLGMRSAVGQGAVQSCASIRAGINRFQEWEYFAATLDAEDEVTVTGSPVQPDLGDRHWIDKFDDLATQPFLEAVADARALDHLQGGEATRTGIFLGLPNRSRNGIEEEDLAQFDEDVAELALFPAAPARLEVSHTDHVAGLLALARAMEALASGELALCIVGGIDTLLHSPCLYDLLAEGRLLSAVNPAGLIPGEAAAFVVIETAGHAKARGVTPRTQLTEVRQGLETANIRENEPTTSRAMIQVLRQTLADAPCDPKRIERISTDLNGERWRFIEWANADGPALSDLPTYWEVWHPADCIGDAGAAMGILNLGVATRAFERSYAVGDAILVCATSISGERAATCVAPIPDKISTK